MLFSLLSGCGDKTLVRNFETYQFLEHPKADFVLLDQWGARTRLLIENDAKGFSPGFQQKVQSYFAAFLPNENLWVYATSPSPQNPYLFFNPQLANLVLKVQIESIQRIPLKTAQANEAAFSGQILPNHQAQNIIFPSPLFLERLYSFFKTLNPSNPLTTFQNKEGMEESKDQKGCDYGLLMKGFLQFSSYSNQKMEQKFPFQYSKSALQEKELAALGLVQKKQTQTTLQNMNFQTFSQKIQAEVQTAKTQNGENFCAAEELSSSKYEFLAYQFVADFSPLVQEYAKLQGKAVNFMENQDQLLVKINQGLNFGLKRGDKVDFFSIRYQENQARLEYEKKASGVITVLLNNRYAWVAMPKEYSNQILFGDYAKKH